jgi:3-oxoacyl-[acyl-carrier protein] reductase
VKPHALVTGASRGIGAAIAKRLAKDGHPILLNYNRNVEKAEAVKAEIEAAGGAAELVRFDVRDRQAVAAILEATIAGGVHIGVLVNNAGITADNPLPSMKPEEWEDVTRTTLDGFFNVTRVLVMPMVRSRWGRIINISSVSGVMGNRGQTNYSAAKAGLIGATRSLALELAKRNVTVNAVAPGLIDTDMLAAAPVDEILEAIPMRRLGKADEVAALVSFLAGDSAGYITGQVIGINGGLA